MEAGFRPENSRRKTAAGILLGYPRTDHDTALNALTQVYDAFARAAHPVAQAWAERFLTNLPATWPSHWLVRPLLSFRLENTRVEGVAQGFVVPLVAIVTVRAAGGVASSRSTVRAEVQRDPDGRMRVNYTSLAAGHPQIFR